ncbi:MAG: chemotaxis protein CheW [Thermoproteota archaeon]
MSPTATALAADSSSQILVFSLLAEKTSQRMDYGVEVGQVQEIGLLENISMVPNAPAYVKGVMNLRGKIITIIDVKEKLGFPAVKEVDASTRILIVGVGSTLMGLLVDQVDEVMRIPASDIEPNPSSITETSPYVKGIAKVNDRLVVILDLKMLLGGGTDDASQHAANTTTATATAATTAAAAAAEEKGRAIGRGRR